MGVSKMISKEARQLVKEQVREHGDMTKSEIVELLRPHCTFDPVSLQEQALNRMVGSLVRSIRDETGVRTAFILKGKDTIVDVDNCESLSKVSEVDDMLDMNIKGLQASKRKTERRKKELAGQMSMLDGDNETREVSA